MPTELLSATPIKNTVCPKLISHSNRPAVSIRIGSGPASYGLIQCFVLFYNVLLSGHKQISGSDILISLIRGYDLPLAGLIPILQPCAATPKIPVPTNILPMHGLQHERILKQYITRNSAFAEKNESCCKLSPVHKILNRIRNIKGRPSPVLRSRLDGAASDVVYTAAGHNFIVT